MITKFLLQLRILPRWVIVVIDVVIVAFSTFLGYLLRFNFDFDQLIKFDPTIGVVANSLACLIALLITKSYSGIVRYTGLKDGLRVLYTLTLTHLLSICVNLLFLLAGKSFLIPNSVLLISFLASFVFLFQYRLLIKNIFSHYSKVYKNKQNVVIFGAGQMGLVTKHLLDDDHRSVYNVVAFFEDDDNKIGKEINGTSIYPLSKLSQIVAKYKVHELVIAVNRLSKKRKSEIVDICLDLNLKVQSVPDLNSWVKGELSINQIKQVNIDDLLERDSIKLSNKILIDHIKGESVCITGAAGSIGSELARQIVQYEPSKLILIDQAESALYDLIAELNTSIIEISFHVADITNLDRIDDIFKEFNPKLIYHAAAYKHVPLMEENPYEAITCNIFGTQNLVETAIKYGAEKFVMVSTDKAVNPTNVMGASKRIAEKYVQSLKSTGVKTSFITTRFGNVLGSNGSVIPHFKRQIEVGGPITVTHPEITRYFMTIGEACELILEAGCMGNGGEIFLFDMGESVKIVDLAKKMIRLSGFEPLKDIDIIFTGLRKGEKLYEELLANTDNTVPTHHDKILVAQVLPQDYNEIKEALGELRLLINNNVGNISLVKLMKTLVPEYKSNSSVYELLD